jgi:hypothetical protein
MHYNKPRIFKNFYYLIGPTNKKKWREQIASKFQIN